MASSKKVVAKLDEDLDLSESGSDYDEVEDDDSAASSSSSPKTSPVKGRDTSSAGGRKSDSSDHRSPPTTSRPARKSMALPKGSSSENESDDGEELVPKTEKAGKSSSTTSESKKMNRQKITSESSDGDEEDVKVQPSTSTKVKAEKAYLDDPDAIFQTSEELTSKSERDKARRFEFLLKKTEIWGHFMQPAVQEALDTDGLSGAMLASKAKGRKPQKKPELPFSPDIAAAASSHKKSTGPTDYITHFDESPEYIKNGKMRDYQVRGLNWLISLHEQGINGILADEMGLGKTIQTISLLGYMKHFRGIQGPHLIIAPKSTLSNWMNEIKRWCPSLKAICLIGSKEERPVFIRNTFLKKTWNVCVTSYEMMRIEKSTLAKVNYQYVVIDEAQKIKNENSQLSSCVRDVQSTKRLLLTGTPLQNNLHELWALLNFLLPDIFSSSEDFDSWFNENNCIDNQNLIDRLHAVLRPFLLRRIKSDVEKSLPPKKEMRIYVQLTPMQREWYKKILLNDIHIISSEGNKTKKALHNVLMHLRKACNHPYLFPGAEPTPFTTDLHLVTNSGKMIVLDKLLYKLKAQQSRVLLFTQFTTMLDILEDYCQWRKFEYCRLDGNTEHEIRQEDIDAYNAPNSTKFIYLLSTRAGGLGINLATADIVIIYDSDWNPQMDLQAMDRAHRIGQKKEVKVFRLVCQDTAEEQIVECAAAKLQLDKRVIQQGRLVGADRNKAATGVELMSIVRFGAEKILKTGNKEGVTDADIDTILAESKLRSDEADRKLNNMSEDNLRELTIEQVELSWDKKAGKEESIDTFRFEGENYRELRKRKSTIDYSIMDGKRRKEQESESRNTDKLDGDDSDDGGSSFAPSTPGSSRNGTPFDQVATPFKPLDAPKDYQFYPYYFYELHWRKVDNEKKRRKHFPLEASEELSLQDANELWKIEKTRLTECDKLSAEELRDYKTMKEQGFAKMTAERFDQYLAAIQKHGVENLKKRNKDVKGISVETLGRYSQVFWKRCHELVDFQAIMAKLGRPEVVTERQSLQQNILDVMVEDKATFSVNYKPPTLAGSRFSAEDDVQLLTQAQEVGMTTPDLFHVLRLKLMKSGINCSQFLRTRSTDELRTRFYLLMALLEDKENGLEVTSSTTVQLGTPVTEKLVLPGNKSDSPAPKSVKAKRNTESKLAVPMP